MTTDIKRIVDYLHDRESLDPLTWYYLSTKIAAGGDLMVCFATRAAVAHTRAFHISQTEIRGLERNI